MLRPQRDNPRPELGLGGQQLARGSHERQNMLPWRRLWQFQEAINTFKGRIDTGSIVG